MAQTYQYKAFISYSHTDKAAGNRLLKRLEGYRVPKRLVGKLVSNSLNGQTNTTVPSRVGRLFRDREELPAAESLTAEVEKAIAQSEFMIVLCSPAAAASRWVNREILEFKKLTGERRILSVILSGEPFSSNQGNSAQECFPPALRFKLGKNGQLTETPAEPLAADFRPHGDGHRRGTLKLVAGLLGVGLDTLIERDLQRKMRRVTFVTAASMLATVSMTLLTYEAITARQDAEHNRNKAVAAQLEADKHRDEAEGLIEFMLTDLKEKLKPVGRLDVLDVVGEEAVNYYDRQKLEDMPSDSLGRRAKAFHLLGEIQNLRGDMNAAQDRFDRAANTTKGLLARDPNNLDRIYEHAQSVFWVGFQDWQRGNYEAAEFALTEYKTLAEELVEQEPNNSNWQLELAYANSNLGTLFLEQLRQPRKAQYVFRRALSIFETLVKNNPENTEYLRDFADAYAWLADTTKITGSLHEAKELRETEVAVYKLFLAANGHNIQIERDLATALRSLAELEFETNQVPQAIQRYNDTLKILFKLTKFDPANEEWQEQLAFTLLYYADTMLALTKYEQTIKTLEQTAPIIDALLKSNPASARRRIELSEWYTVLLAAITHLRGDSEKASEVLRTILRTQPQKVNDILAIKQGPYIFASAHLLQGQISTQSETENSAANDFHQLTNIMASNISTYTPATIDKITRTQWLLNPSQNKQSDTFTTLKKRGYSRPDFIQFCSEYQQC